MVRVKVAKSNMFFMQIIGKPLLQNRDTFANFLFIDKIVNIVNVELLIKDLDV